MFLLCGLDYWINLRVSVYRTLKYVCDMSSVVEKIHFPVSIKFRCGDIVFKYRSIQRLSRRFDLLFA